MTTCAASLAATTTSSRAGLLLEAFWLAGERWSLGSLQNGIYRPRRFLGPAALTLLTAAHSPGQPAPYGRRHRPASGTILYHYRAGSIDQPDNSALRAAFADQLPLILFHGSCPWPNRCRGARVCNERRFGGPRGHARDRAAVADTTLSGLASPPDVCAYALSDVRIRLASASTSSAPTVSAVRSVRRRRRSSFRLRISSRTPVPRGSAPVVNGMALCGDPPPGL